MLKTLAELIDELSIVNVKSFWFVEKIRNNTATVKDAKKIDELNLYRSKLKNAINEYFHERQEVKT